MAEEAIRMFWVEGGRVQKELGIIYAPVISDESGA